MVRAVSAELSARLRVGLRRVVLVAGAAIVAATAWLCLIVAAVSFLVPYWGVPLATLTVALALAAGAWVLLVLARQTDRGRTPVPRQPEQPIAAMLSSTVESLPALPYRLRALVALGLGLGMGLGVSALLRRVRPDRTR